MLIHLEGTSGAVHFRGSVSPSVGRDKAHPKCHGSPHGLQELEFKVPPLRAADPLHKLQKVLGPGEQLV